MRTASTTAGRRLCAALAACLLTASACAARSPLERQQCYNPDAQLAGVLKPFEELRARGCDEGTIQGPSECDRLQREIERLAVVCPAHTPTLMANAVIAYDDKRPAESQQLLDLILSQPRAYPDAAVLRARIAIEDGNIPFARRLLAQQIKLVPDHPGLHETNAAALYLEGSLEEASTELTMAGVLGAPRWRIAYHLGLIEEAYGRIDQASRFYSEALAGNPGWEPAASRLKALGARSPAATPRP
jgi:tetratricopeptide (TPR) repeat protein